MDILTSVQEIVYMIFCITYSSSETFSALPAHFVLHDLYNNAQMSLMLKDLITNCWQRMTEFNSLQFFDIFLYF